MEWRKLLSDKRMADLKDDQSTTPAEDKPSVARSEFQSDYDRTLFSTPVRRLQDKAQVFPLEPNDFVHTRLTHSLEVSNIAQALMRNIIFFFLREEEKLNPQAEADLIAIAATCGLIHDLGNPPFGHSGEAAMRAWFGKIMEQPFIPGSKKNLGAHLDQAIIGVKLSEDFRKFDGNPQTLRLVTKLQLLANHDSLNLTAGTLSAAIKYLTRSDQPIGTHAQEKPGYFYSESTIVEKVRSETGTGTSRNPITFLVEAADDIVYSAIDLEDGFKKGAFTWQFFKDEMMNSDAKSDFDKIFKEVESQLVKRRSRSEGLVISPKAEDEARVQLLRTILIGKHIEAASDAFKEKYSMIMEGTYFEELLKDGKTSAVWKVCKTFARNHVFSLSSILKLELMGYNIITDLLDVFWRGVLPADEDRKKDPFAKRAYDLLSDNYRAVYLHEVSNDQAKNTKVPAEYRKLQLIGDYICGMTDTFATSLHRELFNA